MKFAVFGGDGRIVRLVRLLREDGHAVSTYALDKALSGGAKTAFEAADGADCAVFPLPCAKSGALNAPFSASEHDVAEILSVISPGTLVCAGMADSFAPLCGGLGLKMRDYFKSDYLTVMNASLTAEGAISLILRESPRSVLGSKILVCGYGRIGRLLSHKLCALGAQVAVAARRDEPLAYIRAKGMTALDLRRESDLSGFDFVVNTIPKTIFHSSALKEFGNAVLIELASPPYGFDLAAAEEMGKSVILASGLPGSCSPEAAAEIIRDTIYAIIEEEI